MWTSETRAASLGLQPNFSVCCKILNMMMKLSSLPLFFLFIHWNPSHWSLQADVLGIKCTVVLIFISTLSSTVVHVCIIKKLKLGAVACFSDDIYHSHLINFQAIKRSSQQLFKVKELKLFFFFLLLLFLFFGGFFLFVCFFESTQYQ